MGPSGSAKSTLLTLAGGLDTPTAGSVWIEGTDLASLDASGRSRIRRTSVGYVFQDFNLIPALTASENVSLPRELDGEKARIARRLALTALEEVGIADLTDRFPDEMAGGQLAAVGAAPRTRRGVAASHALVVGFVGAILGAGVGFIPGVAISRPLTSYSGSGPYLDIPWLMIGALVLVLPLLTAAIVGLSARSRLPLVARLD